jgi:hypothetical protein
VYSIGREGERRNLSPIKGDAKGTCYGARFRAN